MVAAGEAQVLLNEMIPMLDPYLDMLPQERLDDFNELKKLGLMQVSNVYDTLYGESSAGERDAGALLFCGLVI